MPFALRTKRGTTIANSDDIDDNWDDIAGAIDALQTAMAAGGVNIENMTTSDTGLTITLSDATVFVLPFSGIPMRILGAWTTGIDYKRGDVLIQGTGSLIVKADHTSTVLDDDIDDAKIAWLARDGSNADVNDYRSFTALGTVTGGARIVGAYICPRACRLSSLEPIAGALMTPVSFGAVALTVDIKKVTAAGVTTTLGTLTFNPVTPAALEAIDEDFAQYDALLIYQTNGATSTGGSDLIITAPLLPPSP